jgi:glycosyltransferase involved in cell wall biosynthesis
MKILIISPYLPHPLSGHGTGTFMYGLIRQLQDRHEITLVSFCDKRELTLAQDLKTLPIKFYPVPRGKGGQKNIWWNFYLVATRLIQFFRSVFLWQPYYVSKFYHPRMARLIEKLTLDVPYDIVQFEMVQMAQYFGASRSGKRILQAHDVAFRPAYRRYKSAGSFLSKSMLFVEWCRWVSYERNIARRFEKILCVTEQDRDLLDWLTSGWNAVYLPRGVDVAERVPLYRTRETESLLFVGTFSHRPNREAAFWLVEEIFPLVLQRRPRSKLYIVGSNPPSELKQIASNMPRVEILGFVDDVVGYLRKASVFVAPLRSGGGVKVKILHAMGQGIPVVTTKVGVEGIEGMNSETALVGDTAQRLAGHICALLENQTLADLIGKNGWEAMRDGYSWEKVVKSLEKIYLNVWAS